MHEVVTRTAQSGRALQRLLVAPRDPQLLVPPRPAPAASTARAPRAPPAARAAPPAAPRSPRSRTPPPPAREPLPSAPPPVSPLPLSAPGLEAPPAGGTCTARRRRWEGTCEMTCWRRTLCTAEGESSTTQTMVPSASPPETRSKSPTCHLTSRETFFRSLPEVRSPRARGGLPIQVRPALTDES